MPLSLSTEDRAEINDLYVRYAYAFDGADADGYAALYMPDGRFSPPGIDPAVGTEALRDFVASRSSEMPGMRHVIANILIEPDGDNAKGRAYFICYRIDDHFRLQNFGRYEDTFARHEGEWRFATRDVVAELDLSLVGAPFAFST